MHDWTEPINRYFGEDLSRRDALIISDGVFIDLIILVQGVRLIFRGTTFRFFFANMAFYGARAILQSLTILQFPKEGYIWDYPGFPSLFV